jgi:DNA-binding IclR family transcriptional regulator
LRSSRAGLPPQGRGTAVPHASASQLARALEEQQELVAHAGPVMEYLYEQTRDSGSMVILADARGMLLHALGDLSFVDRAERVALRPGANWHEHVRGTNAIGTALVDRSATVIHGAEHYLDRNGFLTCAAAPILAPDGELVGALDISGDHRSGHPHTLGLVRAGARLIEQRLFDARHHSSLRLRFHRRAEGIGTLTEGLLALSLDGWVMGANGTALEWLGLRPSQIQGVRLGSLMELENADWTLWLQHLDHRPRQLLSAAYGPVWARLEPGPAARPVVVAGLAPTPGAHTDARTGTGWCAPVASRRSSTCATEERPACSIPTPGRPGPAGPGRCPPGPCPGTGAPTARSGHRSAAAGGVRGWQGGFCPGLAQQPRRRDPTVSPDPLPWPGARSAAGRTGRPGPPGERCHGVL